MYARPFSIAICRALQYFHNVAHVCHRALSSKSVLVGFDSKLKIVKFNQMRHYTLPERLQVNLEQISSPRRMYKEFRTQNEINSLFVTS